MRTLLPIWFTLPLVAGELTAQSVPGTLLRGRVIDARTAVPLHDVRVVLTSGRDTLARAQSDSTGAFQAAGESSASGPVLVHFSRIGYRADSIAART